MFLLLCGGAHIYTYFLLKSPIFVILIFMDKEALQVAIFFIFLLGGGVGFYLAKFFL